ncbi:hypothetical protein ACHQM5_019453 [Ranunculus cassubicifolius]
MGVIESLQQCKTEEEAEDVTSEEESVGADYQRLKTTSIRALLSENSSGVKHKKKEIRDDELKPLWDDGFGKTTVKDYLEISKDMIHNDGGPPRWFCPVECGQPIKDSPLLFFLPGIEGIGFGLCLHHKALGRYVLCFI